jgi:hypothetical protein
MVYNNKTIMEKIVLVFMILVSIISAKHIFGSFKIFPHKYQGWPIESTGILSYEAMSFDDSRFSIYISEDVNPQTEITYSGYYSITNVTYAIFNATKYSFSTPIYVYLYTYNMFQSMGIMLKLDTNSPQPPDNSVQSIINPYYLVYIVISVFILFILTIIVAIAYKCGAFTKCRAPRPVIDTPINLYRDNE